MSADRRSDNAGENRAEDDIHPKPVSNRFTGWFEWYWILGGIALFYGGSYFASLWGFGRRGILLVLILLGPVLVVYGIFVSIRNLWRRRH
jgi:hypothetical protein